LIIEFGEYLPDLPRLGNPGLVKAQNCIPYANSYRPFPSSTFYSANRLSNEALGFLSARDKEGNTYTYAGDTSSLYRLSNSTWIDASRTADYSTASDDHWEMVKWGEKVIATNYTDDIQEITMAASNFAALAGTPPKARHMDIVKDFLVLGNVTDYSSGAAVPNRVHWSGFDNIETWAPAAATQADYQDLQGNGGWIQKIVGGEYGVIFQEKAIWRMTYIGSPIVFQFDQIETEKGTPSPNSVVKVGNNIYYLGHDGFYVFNGAHSKNISHNRIYKTFIDDLAENYKNNIISAADPAVPIILWAYPDSNAVNGRPNKVLIYNWAIDRWSLLEGISYIQSIGIFRGEGYTLDDLDTISTDLDALPYSLDSREWMGNTLNLAFFDQKKYLKTFSGADLTATWETGERQLIQGRRATVVNSTPLVDSASSITVASGTKTLRDSTPTYNTAVTINADGECPMIAEGRYHSFRVVASGGFKQAQGLNIEATPGGRY
jgi:hypothetical protein